MKPIIHPSIYKCKYGELFLEVNEQVGTIIHCTVNEWSVSAYKHSVEVWTEVLRCLPNHKVYAAVKEDDTLLIKFAKKFGFIFTELYSIDKEGIQKRLMICQE